MGRSAEGAQFALLNNCFFRRSADILVRRFRRNHYY
jgi:hypothetical protein